MTMLSDIIEPNSELAISIRVVALTLGTFQVPITIAIKNAADKRFTVNAKIVGAGPEISVSAKEIKFGKVQVLESHKIALTLKNTSPIQAVYSGVLMHTYGHFIVNNSSGVLEPSEEVEIDVEALLYDNFKFNDVFKLSVENGKVRDIHLSAQGIGSNILFSSDVKRVPFGEVLTSEYCERVVTVTNHSKRCQNLMFKNAQDIDPTFVITPDRFSLKPLGELQVTIRGLSKVARVISETIVCFGTLEQDPNRKTIVESVVSASFITPSVTLDKMKLEFSYVQGDTKIKPNVEHELTITNNVNLPLRIKATCPLPFTISRDASFTLQPREALKMTVRFDPELKVDRKCLKSSSLLALACNNHPDSLAVELSAETSYPNLTLSSEMIEIPSTSPGFRMAESFKVTNDSTLPVHYEWQIERGRSKFIYEGGEESIDTTLFDIIPHHGVLFQGENMPSSVTFLSHRKGTFTIGFICKINNGPSYRLKASIRCYDVGYAISANAIELGEICFDEVIERSIVIKNTGEVEFPLQIFGNESITFNKQKLLLTTSCTIVNPGESALLGIKYCPCFLGPLTETFYIQMSNMRPEKFTINVDSLYPRYWIDLPHLNPRLVGVELPIDEEWRLNENISNVLSVLEEEGKSVLSMTVKNDMSRARDRKNLKADQASFLNGTTELHGHYACNFGFLSQTQIKKKSILIKNVGKITFSIQSIKGSYEDKGFSVEYDQYLKLAPGETHKIGLTLKAPKSIIDDSAIKAEAVIELSHGCKFSVIFSANLCVPSLVCAVKDIDFGEVFVGQKKTVSVLLTNNSAVNCDWKLPTPSVTKASTKKKPENLVPKEIFFVTTTGQLLPGQSAYIDISFTPRHNQTMLFNSIFQVLNSNKLLEIPVKAVGVHPKLVIDTPVLNFGQIVPFSDVLERSIIVRNPTKYALDFFIVDLADETCDAQSVDSKPEECAAAIQEAKSLYIFHGPPLSGKSTLALHLCDQYGFRYLAIDDIITDAAERRSNPLLDRIKIEMLKVKQESRQEEQQIYDPATDFDMGLFSLILADHLARNQRQYQIFVLDGLNSQFIKNPSLALKAILQAFDAQTKITVVSIVADVPLLQKRERDRNQLILSAQIAELERELSTMQRKSDGIEHYEKVNTELNKLRKLGADRKENEKQPWKAATRVVDDPKKVKALKTASKEKSPLKKPLLRTSPNSNDDMEVAHTEGNMALITDVFEEKASSREYEEYVSTVEALTVTIIECCQDDARIIEKKIAPIKNKLHDADSVDLRKDDCVVSIEFATFNGFDESIIEVAKLLNLVKPELAVADVKPGMTSTVLYLKQVSDTKPQSKNFKIVSCLLQSDEHLQSAPKSLSSWTLRPDEKLIVSVKFTPSNIAKLDEAISFNVRGIRESYHVRCVASIIHPTFAATSIFQKQRKTRDIEDVIAGEYICDARIYEYGHLVCKPKDFKGPDRHRGFFTLTNDTETSMRVTVSLKSDAKGEIFSIDISAFTINPNSSHVLTVYAFPKNIGSFDDVLVCCIADNPEPYLINLCCTGTKLDMEFEKKHLNFDRNSLGVLEKREISIRNPTTIPVMWRINQQEVNSEELQISPCEGTLQPHEKIMINGTFKSMKQLVLKKTIKVELYELERSALMISENNFTVLAEAYEVAVDIIYAKAEFVEYGSLRVDEESRQTITLKNRGKFDIGYRFVFAKEEFEPMFEITPSTGTLSVNEKNTALQISFTCSYERVFAQEAPIFCELYDLTRESVLGRLPIKISAQVVRSSHLVIPARNLDFGKCCIGVKATRSITIDNNGPYDLKYTFGRQLRPISTIDTSNSQKKKPRTSQLQAPGDKQKKEQAKSETQVFGPFSIHSPTGIISSYSKVNLVVEFLADGEGAYAETLMLDCSDRDAEFYEDALEYVFAGESQIPSIRFDNFSKMFQTIDIIRDLTFWSGIYPVFSVLDNTLFLGPALLNTTISVPITISNVTDVNCDVLLSVKAKHKNDEQTFDISPKAQSIGPQASAQFAISFLSTDLENAYGSFEASVDNLKNDQHFRFEINAQSILPQIEIVRPLGQVLRFVKTAVGTTSLSSITIQNKSLVQSTVIFKGLDDDVFFERDPSNNILAPGEIREMALVFKPTSTSVNAKEMIVSCIENGFESFVMQLEGCISSNTLTIMSGNAEVDSLSFGDCIAGLSRSVGITVRNDYVKAHRVSLSAPAEIYASPSSFTLESGETRDVQVTFQTEKKHKEYKSLIKLQIQDVEGVLADKEQTLVIDATNEYAAYDCNLLSVLFSSTPIHEQNVSSVELKNTGKHSLEYEVKLYRDDGQVQDDDGAFSVARKSGSVSVGDTLLLPFRFCASTVGSFNNYSAIVLVKHTDPADLPLCIRLSGVSTPKACHISYEPALSDNTNSQYFDWVTYTCEETAKRVVLFNNMTSTPLGYSIKTSDQSGEISADMLEGTFAEFKFFATLSGRSQPECITILHTTKSLEVSADKYSINYANVKLHKSSAKSFRLVNNEIFSVDYSIEVLKEHGHAKSFQLDALTGSIPAQSSVQRIVTFRPEFDRVYESSLRILYTNLPSTSAQLLYLRGDGYDLLETVILCESGIERVLQAGEKTKEIFDVGRLVLGEERVSQISIENNGRYPYDFNWSILGLTTKILKISPFQGNVRPGETVLCDLKFLSYVQLKDRRITAVCMIDKERKYPLHINTYFTRSRIDLSESELSFGMNFLHLKESARVLRIVNRERRDINIESSLSHPNIFSSSLKFHTLTEGESLDVTVHFNPESRADYSDVLVIKVDEHSEYRVLITGSGVHHDLQVLDVKDNVVDFGQMKAGSSYSKKVRVKNNSALPLQVQIADKDTITHLLQLGLKITPEKILIKPKEIVPLNLVFTPKGRLGNIDEDLIVYTGDTVCKEISIIGSCQGIELHLSEPLLFLGPTLPNVAVFKTILLENVGEIGSKFVWDTSKFNGIFSMDPKEGFISPKASVSLKFGFKTRSYLTEVKTESITCQIDGARHLTLQISGSCPKNPIITDTIQFMTNVRGKDTKLISVTNPTTSLWRVQPAISGQLFSALQELVIEPNQVKQFSITYAPSQMTGERSDEGFLNIPLPNNTSKLYKLLGTAEKPLACSDLTVQLKMRLPAQETISVSNWVSKPQKLSVSCESNDPMLIVAGDKSIDLASGETKPYQFTVQCLKDGTYPVKVTIANEATGEYIWYSFSYKAQLSDPEPISIVTSVRTRVQKSIMLKNPLDTPLTMNFVSSVAEVTVPTNLILAPRSDTPLHIDYLPTQQGESTAKITSTSTEFGTILHELKLLSKPAKPTSTYTFTSPLGSTQTQLIKFTTYSKTRTEYTCKLDHPDFICERVVVAMPSSVPVEISFEVTFEPSVIGGYKTGLVVSSGAYGDYEFMLHGSCGEPRAMGPYGVKAGVLFNLTLRNVFHVNAVYSAVVDNPCFVVRCPDTIAARKSGVIGIMYTPGKVVAGEKLVAASKYGKLVVTNTVSGTSWTYYLKEQQ